MLFKVFCKHASKISMLIAVAVILCALLWNESRENFNMPTDSVSNAAQIITTGSPSVRIESTDEVYGMILQADIDHLLSAQSLKNKVASEFIRTILKLLLEAVTVLLLHRLVHIWLHRSQRGIVCYIHGQDGKK